MSTARLLAPLAFATFGTATMAQTPDSSAASDAASAVEFFNPNDSIAVNDTAYHPQRLTVIASARGNIESIVYYADSIPENKFGKHYDIDQALELQSSADSYDVWDSLSRLLHKNDPEKLRMMVLRKADKAAGIRNVPENVPIHIVMKQPRAKF